MMRVASLGSGSEGNALVVSVPGTTILLDCGFSLAETTRRLARLDLHPQQLDAILVTHEHTDHISGVASLARRYHLPVHASHGTLSALTQRLNQSQCVALTSDRPYTLGALRIEPFAVPHDAREPLQYVVGDGQRRLGVLTDVGCTTPHIQDILSGCDGLILETNHDPDLLEQGPYPATLKARVRGRFGHLANHQAAQLLASLDRSRLQWVAAAHLSQRNNTPQHARQALAAVLACPAGDIPVLDQQLGLPWRTLEDLLPGLATPG